MHKYMLKKSLQQIRYIMLLQYCMILFMILCGAIVFGFRTDRWVQATEIAEILAVVLTFFMPVAYLRVRNIVKTYCDSQPGFEAEIIILSGAESPMSSEQNVIGRFADMPYI